MKDKIFISMSGGEGENGSDDSGVACLQYSNTNDQFYIHIREVCLSSVTRDILCEISAILLFHLKKRFEDIANVLVLLEFHDERAI